MQLYKYDTSRDGTHRQAGGRSVNVALLVEDSSRSTVLLLLRVGVKQKKVIVLIDCFFFYNSQGPIFIPGT